MTSVNTPDKAGSENQQHEHEPERDWLSRSRHLILTGLPALGRDKRYLRAIAIPMALIWGVALLWLAAGPDRYESEMTLILPGSGVGGSLNLESIGQASATTNSAFASPYLSPTENYKRLLMSDLILEEAANSLHESPASFPRPDVKLVDQTNLIIVTMSGDTPEQAQNRAKALQAAFSLELDKLRQDEAASREKVDLHRIADLEHKVADAQRALLAFQGRTGLVSLDQFNNRIAALDDLKASERQAQAARVREQASAGRLAATLGVSTSTANRALKLQGDPIFQKLLIRYADAEAEEAQKSGTLGPAHARIEQLGAERSAIRTAMAARGSALAGLNQETVMRFAEVS
ncbi:MAG: hypothetical protein ACK5NN_05205, partial [Sphingomonadaceae bacterium]